MMTEPFASGKDLASSMVYLAPGIDLQPLLRFSDIITNYVYIGLGVDEDELEQSLRRRLRFQEDRLQLVEAGRRMAGSDLGLRDRLCLPDRPYPWMTQDEWNEFRSAFSCFKQSRQWAREFTLLRRVAGEELALHLLYVNAEAMDTYQHLMTEHSIAPFAVCSVQSGRMEEPGGVLERLMIRSISKPELWLRGFEPKYWSAFFQEPQELRAEIPALDRTGLWRHKVQSYANWYSRGKDSNRALKRYTACFAQAAVPWCPLPRQISLEHKECIVTIRRQTLKPEDLQKADLLVARQAVLDKLVCQQPSVRACSWEAAYGFNQSLWSPYSLKQALEHISSLCSRHSARRILMLPVGLEDEGAEIQAWLESDLPKPDSLEIRTRDYLDFYTLFCPQPGRKTPADWPTGLYPL